MISIGDVIQIIKIVPNLFKRWKCKNLLTKADSYEKKGELHTAYDICRELVRKFDKADELLDYVAEALVKQGELGYQLYCCDRNKNKKEREEAKECFSKVIEFVPYGRRRRSVAKAYVGRGGIEQEEGAREAAQKDYDEVLKKNSNVADPDVVLEVARARLNRGTINLQNCNNSDYDKLDYDELIEIERKYHKRAYHDELRKLVALQFYNKALSYYENSKIDEALTACKQALEKCKKVKKKDTENIDIDVQNVSCFHFWEGKPISCREIKVNVLMLQGLAYVQEIWINCLMTIQTKRREVLMNMRNKLLRLSRSLVVRNLSIKNVRQF